MNCPQESSIIHAVRTTEWTTGLRSHAETCPMCKEAITMTTTMNRLATIEPPHPLPGYRLIWLKAQYARKQERISALDMITLIAMSLAGIAGLAGLLFWRFPNFLEGVLGSGGTGSFQWSTVFSGGTPLIAAVGALVIVWLLTRDSFFAER